MENIEIKRAPLEGADAEKFDADGNERTLQSFPDGTTGVYSKKEYSEIMDNWDRSDNNA